MVYHNWGDKDKKGRDVCYRVGDVADYIGCWLRTWARINVLQIKEKFGEVRIYCTFGWDDLHSVTHPGHAYYRYGKVGMFINQYTRGVFKYLNYIIVPIHKYLYCWRYHRAIKKWPELRDEILQGADFGELFEGRIPGYKHSDYWTTVGGE